MARSCMRNAKSRDWWKKQNTSSTISKPTLGKKVLVKKEVNPDKKHLKLVRTVNIAQARGYDLEKLLQHGIAALSFYLFCLCLHVKKPFSKFDLLKELRMLPTLKSVSLK